MGHRGIRSMPFWAEVLRAVLRSKSMDKSLMSQPKSRSLADLLASVEKRKAETLRAKLGIPTGVEIPTLQLESLAYHLTERSGPIYLKLEGEALRVAETQSERGLPYSGAAAEIVLKAWGISRDQAASGVAFTVKNGKRC